MVVHNSPCKSCHSDHAHFCSRHMRVLCKPVCVTYPVKWGLRAVASALQYRGFATAKRKLGGIELGGIEANCMIVTASMKIVETTPTFNKKAIL